MDELEYITKNALMMCDQGAAPDFFKPTYNTHIKIHGCLVATKVDFTPLTNIPSFKICKLTQKPCLPATTIPWEKTWPVKVMGEETLIGESTCRCTVGGTVEFMTSGQIPLPDDALQEVKDLQAQAQRELDDSGNGDSVGEAGFAEGMIPVWGSGRDMINDIQTGDVGGAQKALQGLGKAGFKKLSKEALKKSTKDLAEKLGCFVVKGCFSGETLIHTEKGLIQIKDIKIGDNVFSYDAEKDAIVLNKVSNIFENEVDEILEIKTDNETIRTTRNHPFYVNGEFKDAEQIRIGDALFSKEMQKTKIISMNFVPEVIKVYTFEVENSHCYFVGEEGILVLNECYRKIFFEAFPELKGLVGQVHHAIPQKIFTNWPNLFDKQIMNSLENLRGIPKDIMFDLHQKTINKEWNRFYDLFKKSGKNPTKDDVLKYVDYIDNKYGHLFIPPKK